MTSSAKYWTLPTEDSMELSSVSDHDDGCRQPLDRQMSNTASAGSTECAKRIRQENERRRERLNTELLNAVSGSDEKKVIELIRDGAKGNACCRHSGVSALHLAAARGDAKTFNLLLANGGNPRANDQKGREPVHMATWNNHIPILKILVGLDYDVVNTRVETNSYLEDANNLDSWNHNHDNLHELIPIYLEDGTTPLHIACMRGFYDCVEFLILNKAMVNVSSSKNVTPADVIGLHMSITDTTKQVGTDDAGPENETEDEPRFMMSSSRPDVKKSFRKFDKKSKHPNALIRIYEELINPEASDSERIFTSSSRQSTNRQVTTTALHTAVIKNDCEFIEFILEKEGTNYNGSILTTWNSDGETALHVAVREKLYDPLKIILSWDGDQWESTDGKWSTKVNVRDSQGMTPLLLATKLEWSDGVALLLEEGADVTMTSNKNDNETVLHYAARHGNEAMVRALLDASNGAKILEWTDRKMNTPVCCAVESGSLECLKLLKDKNANLSVSLLGNINMLHVAAEKNSPEMIEFLLKDDAVQQQQLVDKVSQPEKGGVAPLHIAALNGYHECVEMLISGGCNVNIQTADECHRSSSALHLAAARGHYKVLEPILLRDRKSHKSRNADYWTPLHAAAANGHAKCVRTLLWCGADLGASVRDETGRRTALDLIMLCIPQPVDFLEEILTSYVIPNGDIKDEDCQITLNYDLLVPDDRCQRQLKVMNAFLNCGKIDTIQKLLLHPLIETFLYLKWRKLSIFFIVIMSLYLIMTVSLTSYACMMYIAKSTSTPVQFCANIACIILMFFDIIILFLEIMNLIQLHQYYVKDIESLVKWGMIITSFIVGLADPTYTWTKYVAATAVLLSWMELLFLLARCPSWGYYVLMFSRVAVNVLKVLGTFTLLFVGFTFSFLILFEGKEPFRSFFEALIKVIVMMLEFDYQNMFEPVKDVTALSVTGRVIFLSFVVLVSIVMMNLMLGLAVSDISALKAQGKTQRLVKQTQFLSLLEMVVYNKTLKKLMPPGIYRAFENKRAVDQKIIVRPGKPIETINHTLPKKLREAIINSIWVKTQADAVEVTINLEDINQKITDLTNHVKNHSSSSSSSTSNSSFKDAFLKTIISRLDEIQTEQKAMKLALNSIALPPTTSPTNSKPSRLKPTKFTRPIPDQNHDSMMII